MYTRIRRTVHLLVSMYLSIHSTMQRCLSTISKALSTFEAKKLLKVSRESPTPIETPSAVLGSNPRSCTLFPPLSPSVNNFYPSIGYIFYKKHPLFLFGILGIFDNNRAEKLRPPFHPPSPASASPERFLSFASQDTQAAKEHVESPHEVPSGDRARAHDAKTEVLHAHPLLSC